MFVRRKKRLKQIKVERDSGHARLEQAKGQGADAGNGFGGPERIRTDDP
jgi:hypothetical protein